MPYVGHMVYLARRPDRVILSGQYFIHFAVMGIVLPYFNLYCYHIGLTGFQIGAVSALRSAVLVLFSMIWSALADRFLARKPIYILCLFVSTMIWTFYFYSNGFWEIFIITLFYGIFYSPIISFLETFTMELLGEEKKSYGRIRAWGSISFIAVVVFLGKAIDHFSVEIILPLVFVGSLLQTGMSLKIPKTGSSSERPALHQLKRLYTRPVIWFLICSFLMLMSHGAYYGFFSIHLEHMGYSKTFIGAAWALASVSEILVMINSKAIFSKCSIERVLTISFFIAALRWASLIFARSPYLILVSQISHALTYGAFHMGSILYIDSLVPQDFKTVGQAANNAVTYGLGLMAGFLISGSLYENTGSSGLFAASGLIALLGGVLFSTHKREKNGFRS